MIPMNGTLQADKPLEFYVDQYSTALEQATDNLEGYSKKLKTVYDQIKEFTEKKPEDPLKKELKEVQDALYNILEHESFITATREDLVFWKQQYRASKEKIEKLAEPKRKSAELALKEEMISILEGVVERYDYLIEAVHKPAVDARITYLKADGYEILNLEEIARGSEE